VFERFTDNARQVVVLAQEEARLLDHNWIGTEHILLGIMRHKGSAGFRLLELLNVPPAVNVRERVLEIVGPGRQSSPPGHIPFTPRAKKVLEMSLREALALGDGFIGSEHLLLGLLREGDGVGAQILVESNITRAAVQARLGDIEREEAPPAGDAPADEPGGEEMIHIPAADFGRLVAMVTRLRELLRHHGIDPDEELPAGPEPEDGSEAPGSDLGDGGGPR
jgi:ATP-dependent Clp protease ATP-binding subunit ClpC